MTRQIHDQFAKEYLEELLASLGTIKKSKKVKSEVQEIDVWFEPASSASRTELPLGGYSVKWRRLAAYLNLSVTHPPR